MLCARECPAWCIYIDSHKDVVPATTEGGKDKTRNVLDRFAIDFSICMYCSICIEVCPFDALHWSPEFEYAELDIRELTHEKDRLREWMWTVPRAARARRARRAGQGDRRRAEGGPTRPEKPARAGDAGGRRRERVEASSCCSSLVALGSALLVVTTVDLVHAALWLVVTLGAVAGCFLLLAAEFVAWVQVLIYVGAVVVLLLFALMLTRAPTGPQPTTSPSRRAAAGRGRRGARRRAARRHGGGRLPRRADRPRRAPSSAPPSPPATTLFTIWVLPFEVLSVLLLAALVGAIALSRMRNGDR